MKKLLGVVTLLALVGASAPSIAAVKVDLAPVAQRTLVIEVAQAMATRGITTAEQLATANIAGVTALNAASLMLLANPVTEALKAKGMTATVKDFDSVRTAVEGSPLNAQGTMEALAKQITTNGSFDLNSLSAEISRAAGSSNNVLPSVAAAQSPTEFLAGWTMTTEAGQQALANGSEDPEADAILGQALQYAVTAAAETCDASSLAACTQTTVGGTEFWAANGYNQKLKPAATFQYQVMIGFEGIEAQPAPRLQYLRGFANANEGIFAKRQAGLALTPDLQQLDICLATGQNSVN